MSYRETIYYLESLEAFPSDTDQFDTRELWDAEVDFFTEVFNVFNVDVMGMDRIKHTIRPQLRYSYVPDIDQSNLPSFDGEDRVAKGNLLTYSLTQRLTSRSLKQGSETPESDQEDDRDKYNYSQFLRFLLENSYDINRELDDQPRPFSDVTAILDFVPYRYVTLRADAKYNPYDKKVFENNIATTIRDHRGDRLFVEYRRTLNSSESIYFDMLVKITDKLTAYGDYEQNLFTKKRIRSSGGVRYLAQCWSADFRYVNEVTDKRFEFSINLAGLGRIGHGFFGRVMESPLSSMNQSDQNLFWSGADESPGRVLEE